MLPADLKVVPGGNPESCLQPQDCTRRAEFSALTPRADNHCISTLPTTFCRRRVATNQPQTSQYYNSMWSTQAIPGKLQIMFGNAAAKTFGNARMCGFRCCYVRIRHMSHTISPATRSSCNRKPPISYRWLQCIWSEPPWVCWRS